MGSTKRKTTRMTKIVLLDGGLGQELIHRTTRPVTPLWMAQMLMDEPELVEAVQREFVDAGAQVLTLAAYTATPMRLARDASEELFDPLQQAAIDIAKRATAGNSTKIAGCLPPLVASYKPELAPHESECIQNYQRIVAAQNDAVDLFQCETLSTIKEIRASVTAAVETGKPVWCSMSVQDDDGTLLRSGETVKDAANAAIECGAQAVLVNCSSPEAIIQALDILARSGTAFGAYANGFISIDALQAGGTVEALQARTDLNPEAYAKLALSWVDRGASIVGGCCEVGPTHIKTLANQLNASGHTIVAGL